MTDSNRTSKPMFSLNPWTEGRWYKATEVDTEIERLTAENRVTCQLCYGQNGAHQKGCVDYKEPLPSKPLLDPSLLMDNAACASQCRELLDDHPTRQAVLLNVYRPLWDEIERLTAELSESREHAGRMLAKQCRLTGEKDRLRVFVEEVAGMDCARYTKAVHSGDPKWSCGMCLSCRARALAGEDRPKDRPADETTEDRRNFDVIAQAQAAAKGVPLSSGHHPLETVITGKSGMSDGRNVCKHCGLEWESCRECRRKHGPAGKCCPVCDHQ